MLDDSYRYCKIIKLLAFRIALRSVQLYIHKTLAQYLLQARWSLCPKFVSVMVVRFCSVSDLRFSVYCLYVSVSSRGPRCLIQNE